MRQVFHSGLLEYVCMVQSAAEHGEHAAAACCQLCIRFHEHAARVDLMMVVSPLQVADLQLRNGQKACFTAECATTLIVSLEGDSRFDQNRAEGRPVVVTLSQKSQPTIPVAAARTILAGRKCRSTSPCLCSKVVCTRWLCYREQNQVSTAQGTQRHQFGRRPTR